MKINYMHDIETLKGGSERKMKNHKVRVRPRAIIFSNKIFIWWFGFVLEIEESNQIDILIALNFKIYGAGANYLTLTSWLLAHISIYCTSGTHREREREREREGHREWTLMISLFESEMENLYWKVSV
jgi:hypothetical protein